MSDELRAELAIRTQKDRAEDFIAVVASVSPLEVRWRGEQLSAVNGMADSLFVIGDTVRVVQFAEQLVVYAKQSPLPILGVVSAYTASTANCTVISGDDTFDAQIIGSGWTPAAGDRVAVLWTSAGPFVAKRGGPVANPANPPQPPDNMNATSGPDLPTPKPPSATANVAVLYAQQTACYRNSASLYTAEQARYWLYSGYNGSSDAISGYYFYGDQLAKVRGVVVTKAEVWLQRVNGIGPSGNATFVLELHTSKTKPTTQPTTSSPTYNTSFSLANNQSGWFTLPTQWGAFLATGAWAGLGISTQTGGEPYKALFGIDHPDPNKKNAQSGAIRITYKRS